MIRRIATKAIQWSARIVRGYVWVRRPPALESQKVCLLASYSADGTIANHTLYLAQHWKSQGFKVLLIVASDRKTFVGSSECDLSNIDGLMWRRNAGYDFGSWAVAMRSRPDIRDASLLAITNDSVYGPLTGFPEFLARVEATRGDVVGMTDSYEVRHHFQSYLVFYRPRALKSTAFEQFWTTLKEGGREDVIFAAEVPQMGLLMAGGLDVAILFPVSSDTPVNPTLFHWRSLLDAGFPFVKVDLLRSNPARANLEGWEEVLANRGFDPARVREHLGLRFASSAASAALSDNSKAAPD